MIQRFAVALLLCLTLAGPAAAQNLWQAGSARVNITPKQFMWMSGYGGRTTPAEGKLTDLWIKALALEDPTGNQAVLITADLVGIGAKSTRHIAGELKTKFGLSRDQFAIATSHTHTGPALSDNLVPLHYLRANEAERARIVDYTIWMRNKCVEAVGMALKAKQPSHITWGSGQCTVAVNRRNNSEKNVPQLRIDGKLQGPYDHDVPVLVIRDKDQHLKTVVFGYACHATVLPILKWSGDYPGFAQLALEEMHPEINAMFWAGCGADQNPLPRRTVALARHYGRRLAISVDKVINGTLRPIEGNLKTNYQEITARTQAPPSAAEVQKMVDSDNGYQKAYGTFLQNQLAKNKALPTSYQYPIQTFQFGEVKLILLGGEVVVDYAIKLKQGPKPSTPWRDPSVWVAGYSNDVMAYIPSLRVLKEGGYEGGTSNRYYGLAALWDEGVEQEILTEVRRQISGN